MWARIEAVPSELGVICLPASMTELFGPTVTIKFGGITVKAETQQAEGLGLEKSTFETPGKLIMSGKVQQELLIPETQIYQLRIVDGCLKIGPVIGFLLGNQTNRYTPRHMEKYSDRFGTYSKVGGLIYAFSPSLVDWKNNSASGLYYDIERKQWVYGSFPLPEVIYRRDFHTSAAVVRRLGEYTHGRLFNSYRYNKYELYRYLRHRRLLREAMPPTEISSGIDQVREFIERHGKVILKPLDLSRGRGICIITPEGEGFRISDYRTKVPVYTAVGSEDELEDFLILNPGFFNQYLVQKYLPLARVDDAVFDIRVVMQRYPGGKWGCTGIECRVSTENSQITNISRGGFALSLEKALKKSFPDDAQTLSRRIDELCEEFCSTMDGTGEHFAEFGVDIAVDVDKKLWIIEANVFPSFKGFKKTDPDTYLAIRYTPLLYAVSLTDFGEGREPKK